jgi:sugar phosphate isomerase/epimerase
MNSPLSYGVQSYCFREFKDNAVVAKKVRGLGLDFIELCGVHADLGNVAAFRPVVQTYRDAGVSIRSLGVQTFDGDPAERAWFECAAAAGAKLISCHFRVDSFTRAIPRVRRWSQEFGIRAGIHCHGGYQFGGQLDVLTHLLDLGGPEIGLCIDTAWAMQIGPRDGNAVDWVKKFSGRIYGVHLKDFTFAPNGQWQDTIVGEGNLDLPAFAEALRQDGFDGVAVLEYEGDFQDPEPALRRCVDSMRARLH